MGDFKDLSDMKRLFFGLEIQAPWMHPFPRGRILKEENRHVTIAFLGNVSLSKIQKELKDFPLPRASLGLAGRCDSVLFLPKENPHVVAGHIDWLDMQAFIDLHQSLSAWLIERGYKIETREILSHITIARTPFNEEEWKEAFVPFPLITKSFNLYESIGNLNYRSLWSLPYIAPIEEIEHTADLAFCIRGKNIQQLFLHAQLALAFEFSDMLHYFSDGSEIQSLDDLIIELNRNVSRADAETGCPFKAVSFHGNVKQKEEGFMQWEMIVDV